MNPAAIALVIGLLLAGIYVLILIKAHWTVRVLVSALILVGSIKLTAWRTTTTERNKIWNRSIRPLGNIFTIAQQHYLEKGHTVEVNSMLSRLNEGGLLSETFFGRTNYPDYDALFKPLKNTNTESRAGK
jgi:hypothetical protein